MDVQNAMRRAYNSAYVQPVALREPQQKAFDAWSGLSNVVHSGTDRPKAHPLLRAANVYLRETVLHRLQRFDRGTVCMVGTTVRELEEFSAALPQLNFTGIVYAHGPRDSARVAEQSLGAGVWADALRKACRQVGAIVGPVVVWDKFDGPVPLCDVAVSLDGVLNLRAPQFLRRLAERGVKLFYSVHHSCAELATLPAGRDLRHAELDYSWRRALDGTYTMVHDAETPYFHTNCESWWGPVPGWEYSAEAGGAGYRLWAYSPCTAAGPTAPQWQYKDVVRTMDPWYLAKYGEVRVVYVHREALEAAVMFVEQLASNVDKPLKLADIFSYFRGRTSVVSLTKGAVTFVPTGWTERELMGAVMLEAFARLSSVRAAFHAAIHMDRSFGVRAALTWWTNRQLRAFWAIISGPAFLEQLEAFHAMPHRRTLETGIFDMAGVVARAFVDAEAYELALLRWEVAPPAAVPSGPYGSACAWKFDWLMRTYYGSVYCLGAQPYGMAWARELGKPLWPTGQVSRTFVIEEQHLAYEAPRVPAGRTTLVDGHVTPVFTWLDDDPRTPHGKAAFTAWAAEVLDGAFVLADAADYVANFELPEGSSYRTYNDAAMALAQWQPRDILVSDLCCCHGFHWGADPNGEGLVPCCLQLMWLDSVADRVQAVSGRAVVKLNTPFAHAYVETVAGRHPAIRMAITGHGPDLPTSEVFVVVEGDGVNGACRDALGMALTRAPAVALFLILCALCLGWWVEAPWWAEWALVAACLFEAAYSQLRARRVWAPLEITSPDEAPWAAPLRAAATAAYVAAAAPVAAPVAVALLLALAFVARWAVRAVLPELAVSLILLTLAGRLAVTLEARWFVWGAGPTGGRATWADWRALWSRATVSLGRWQPTAWDAHVAAAAALQHRELVRLRVDRVAALYGMGGQHCALYRDAVAGPPPVLPAPPAPVAPELPVADPDVVDVGLVVGGEVPARGGPPASESDEAVSLSASSGGESSEDSVDVHQYVVDGYSSGVEETYTLSEHLTRAFESRAEEWHDYQRVNVFDVDPDNLFWLAAPDAVDTGPQAPADAPPDHVGGDRNPVRPRRTVPGRALPPVPSAPPPSPGPPEGRPPAFTPEYEASLPRPVAALHEASTLTVTRGMMAALLQACPQEPGACRVSHPVTGESARQFELRYLGRPGDPTWAIVWLKRGLPVSGVTMPTVFITAEKPAGEFAARPYYRTSTSNPTWFVWLEPGTSVTGVWDMPGLFGECAVSALSFAIHGHGMGTHIVGSPLLGLKFMGLSELVAAGRTHGVRVYDENQAELTGTAGDKAFGDILLDPGNSHARFRPHPHMPLALSKASTLAVTMAGFKAAVCDMRLYPGTQRELSVQLKTILTRFDHMLEGPDYATLSREGKSLEAAAVLSTLKQDRPCRTVKMAMLQALPGAGKTRAACEFALRVLAERGPGKVMYCAASKSSLDSFLGEYASMTGDRSRDTGPGVYAKTHIVAYVTDQKGVRNVPAFPSTIEWVVIDEYPTYLAAHMAALAEFHPAATLVVLGDDDQMRLDVNQFYNRMEDGSPSRLADVPGYPALLAKALTLGPTYRFGPDTAHALTRLCKVTSPMAGQSKCERGTSVHVFTRAEFMALDPALRAKIQVIASMRSEKYSDQYEWPPIKSFLAAQGSTTPYTGIIVDEQLVRMFQEPEFGLPGSLYVALTRHQYGLVFIIEPDLVPRAIAFSAVVAPLVKALSRHVGGEYLRLVDRDHPATAAYEIIHPGAREPTVFYDHRLKAAPPPYPAQFCFALVDQPRLPDGNLWQHVSNLPEPAAVDVTLRTAGYTGAVRHLLLVTDTIPGNRMHSGTGEQLALTVVARQLANRRVRQLHGAYQPYQVDRVRAAFKRAFIDPAKLAAFWAMPVAEYVEASVRNEFLAAISPWTEDNERATIAEANAALSASLRLHLKSQIKPKSVEATFEPKAGQPIAAMSKLINLIYGPVIRAITANFRAVFKDNVIYATRASIKELGARWTSPGEVFPYIVEADVVEFDASQTKATHATVNAVWNLLNDSPDALRSYFEYQNGAWVVSRYAKYLSHGIRNSGGPDTFDANTVLLMAVFAIMGEAGLYGQAWFHQVVRCMFGGDDSLIACRVDPKVLFNFDWARTAFDAPLKLNIRRDTGVGEFFHHIFANGTAAYNSRVAEKKILCKNYAQVMASKAHWKEFMLAWSDMTMTWADDFWGVSAAEAEYYAEQPALVQTRMSNLIAFGRLSMEAAQRELPLRCYAVPSYVALPLVK